MAAGYTDVVGWIERFASEMAENKQYLTRLDSAIGDGDHGLNMDRGMQAALQRIEPLPDGDIGALLKTVGMALISKVGGASGPLYGTLFIQLGGALAGATELTAESWGRALGAAVDGVQARGKAQLEDKTMLDALIPAKEAFLAAVEKGTSFEGALASAAGAAKEGMSSTIDMVARKGRASYLGDRSAGHQDPGATSSFLLLEAAAECWGEDKTGMEQAGSNKEETSG